jgi:hypothetical protein
MADLRRAGLLEVVLRLADLAKIMEQDGDLARSRAARLKPGTKPIRERRGETHTVIVLEDGFEWRGTPVVPQNLVGRRNPGLLAHCRLPFAACKRSS